jgi:tripartite-type tricarboxylate transporter receptor subunit TctC
MSLIARACYDCVMIVLASSPAELDAFMRADIEKWRKVIQTAKIRNE